MWQEILDSNLRRFFIAITVPPPLESEGAFLVTIIVCPSFGQQIKITSPKPEIRTGGHIVADRVQICRARIKISVFVHSQWQQFQLVLENATRIF